MDEPMMHKDKNLKSDEQGVALVATLMFLLAMGVLSTALISAVNNEMRSGASYKYGEQAFYVANAGIQKAVQWFGNSYTPWVPASSYDATSLPVEFGGSAVTLAGQAGSSSVFPSNSAISSFTAQFHNMSLQANYANSGTYSLNATLLKYTPANFINPNTFLSYASAVERWRLDSTGIWGPSVERPLGTAQVTAIMENSGSALFDRALFGIEGLELGGTVLVDSYDPQLGAYGGTNTGSDGSVGSNAIVSASGNVTVDGDLVYGPSGSFVNSGNASVTGTIAQLPAPRYFPPIPNFSVGTTTLDPKNGTMTIDPGSYGNVKIGPNGVLALNPGVYYFDSITQSATGSLQINSSLGDTIIFVKSGLDLSGQGVVNLSGDPGTLTIYYSGTNDMKISGGSSAFIEVYAPNAHLQLVGNTDFYGSFIGKTVSIQGTPEVHFNEGSLEKNLFQQPFRLISWSRNSF